MTLRFTDPRFRRVSLSRRRFIESSAALGTVLALARATSAPAAAAAPFEPESATTLARRIRNREITASEAVRACLARIESSNPKLNSMVTVCRERALAEAMEADQLLSQSRPKGALHGVPFTVSDAFDSAGVVSTGGTLGRRTFVPAKDATIVARSRAAGAILLGKTNTTELSLEGASDATTNLVCGVTHNPYDLRRNAGGAAGGSAAAVASGASFFDVASSDDGAIRRAASANGLAGLKPTLGRLPRTGHIVGYGGAFDSFVELGLLARHVEDLMLLLPILSGPDGADATLAPVPLRDPSKVDLASLRITHEAVNGSAAVERCVANIRALGAKVAADSPPKLEEFGRLKEQYQAGDGRAHVRRLLRKYSTEKASPELLVAGVLVESPELSRLCEALDTIRSEQLAWMQSQDLVICATGAAAPAGWPAGIVRISTAADGMPECVQLVARPWREDVLLAAMLHIERTNGGWKPPRLERVST